MHNILILNAKGGCGKTTIATNIAVHCALKGYNTVILDQDVQGSSTKWLSLRPKENAPIRGIAAFERSRADVTRSWQTRVPPGTDRMIIDAPAGASGGKLMGLVQRADTIIIPVLPSPIDIHVTTHFIQDLLLIGKIRSRNTRVAVVGNRVKESNPRIYVAFRRFLDALHIPFVTEFRDSHNYLRAAQYGLGILEMESTLVEKDLVQWTSLFDWINNSIPLEIAAVSSRS